MINEQVVLFYAVDVKNHFNVLKTFDTLLEVADYNNNMNLREKVGQANVYNIKRTKKRWLWEKRHN